MVDSWYFLLFIEFTVCVFNNFLICLNNKGRIRIRNSKNW